MDRYTSKSVNPLEHGKRSNMSETTLLQRLNKERSASGTERNASCDFSKSGSLNARRGGRRAPPIANNSQYACKPWDASAEQAGARADRA